LLTGFSSFFFVVECGKIKTLFQADRILSPKKPRKFGKVPQCGMVNAKEEAQARKT
jgi:hypothetical protein